MPILDEAMFLTLKRQGDILIELFAGRGHPPQADFATNPKRFPGRGSVWLERLLWEQEVDSSSLSAPILLRPLRYFNYGRTSKKL